MFSVLEADFEHILVSDGASVYEITKIEYGWEMMDDFDKQIFTEDLCEMFWYLTDEYGLLVTVDTKEESEVPESEIEVPLGTTGSTKKDTKAE